ncbi:MAG: ferrous iron transport protein A, partial [Xenococcus sp. (in: cyanobacteria)]
VNRDKLARPVAQNQLMDEQLFPLSTTQIGDRVVIAQILSGQNMEHHLSQMGLTRGSEVQVISKTRSGSVILCIQDEQIGLGAGMAERVMVTLVAEQ